MGTSEPAPDSQAIETQGNPAETPATVADPTPASPADSVEPATDTSEAAATTPEPTTDSAPETSQAAAAADPSTPTDSSDPASVTPPESGAPPDPAISPDLTDPAVQAAVAATQTSADDQTVAVPEQRPQVFTQPDPVGQSEASKRAAAATAPAATQADYDRANSDEAKEASVEAGRLPNLIVGTRVQISGDHPEAGRMAHVVAVEYASPIDALLGSSATPEARFAEVADYIVRTRDGRSDVLVTKPDQVTPLDSIQGWGRGQI